MAAWFPYIYIYVCVSLLPCTGTLLWTHQFGPVVTHYFCSARDREASSQSWELSESGLYSGGARLCSKQDVLRLPLSEILLKSKSALETWSPKEDREAQIEVEGTNHIGSGTLLNTPSS